MNARYIVLLYGSMLLVPLLLFLNMMAIALNKLVLVYAFCLLLIAGLLVYSFIGAAEIYSSRRFEAEDPLKTIFVESREHKEKRKEGEVPVTIKLKRFSPDNNVIQATSYQVNANRFTTVLDGLISVKEKQDNSLSMRYSCRQGVCGSCGMVINGKPSLACETPLCKAADKNGSVEIEPMQAHPLLKDLVTDFDDFLEKHASVEPHLVRRNIEEQDKAKAVYKQSKEQLDKYLPYSYCIMCGLCMDACPVVNSNPKFIGPQALSQVYRYHKDSRDQMGTKRIDLINGIDSVWGCEFAGACSDVCPKGVDPAGAIQALKFEIFGEYLHGGKRLEDEKK